MRTTTLAVCALLAIAPAVRAADVPAAQAITPVDLASLLEGEFTTQPAPMDQAVVSQTQTPPVYANAKLVGVPSIGRYVVYAEVRNGAKDGPLQRQLVYSLEPDPDTGRITMAFYALNNPQAFVNAYADPTLFANLTPATVKKYPAGCEIVWHRTDNGFAGDIESDKCTADRPENGKPAALPAHLTIFKEGMTVAGAAGKPTIFRRLR